MGSAIFSLVDCKIQLPDQKAIFERVTFKEISVGIAKVDKLLVTTYMKDKYGHNAHVEIIDVAYFQNEADYNKYVESQK